MNFMVLLDIMCMTSMSAQDVLPHPFPYTIYVCGVTIHTLTMSFIRECSVRLCDTSLIKAIVKICQRFIVLRIVSISAVRKH